MILFGKVVELGNNYKVKGSNFELDLSFMTKEGAEFVDQVDDMFILAPTDLTLGETLKISIEKEPNCTYWHTNCISYDKFDQPSICFIDNWLDINKNGVLNFKAGVGLPNWLLRLNSGLTIKIEHTDTEN